MRDSRRTRLTLVLLLLTAFTLTALDYNSAQSGPLASLRRGIDTVFGPVQKAVGGAANSVGNALGGLPRLGSYQSDNRKLTQENERLNGIIRAKAGLQCDYDQAIALQNFVDYTSFPVVPAHVVSVGTSSDFEWTAVIDVGRLDGIKASMTVVTGQGLVGRTTTVQARTSQVLLLADKKFTVGGTLVGQSTVGLASGDGAGPMSFSLPNTRNQVTKGQLLLTTGGGTYAPGVPIGTVTAVTPDINGVSRIVTIAPFVDVSHLELVGIITLPERTAPRVPLQPHVAGASPTSSPCPAAQPQGPVPSLTPTPTPTPSVPVSPGATATPTPTRTP